MKISELAAALGASASNLREDVKLRAITTLENAGPGDVSFVGSDKYLAAASTTRASLLLVPSSLAPEQISGLPATSAFIALKEPWSGVRYILQELHPETGIPDFCIALGGIHPSAVVDASAEISPAACIGPHAVVAAYARVGANSVVGPGVVVGRRSVIGEGCILHAGVVLQHGTQLGNRVIVHANAVLGADGFKYEVIEGKWTKIPQVGVVIIGDDVEIGANTCIDRASFTETRIGAGTKIDNLVQIAHNVRIGAGCIIVSQTGIAGSTEVGDGCIVAAQAGIADNLKIGNRVIVLARAAVKDNLRDGEKVIGTPARSFRQAARIMMAETRLPDLLKEVDQLRAKVEALEKRLAESSEQ